VFVSASINGTWLGRFVHRGDEIVHVALGRDEAKGTHLEGDMD